MTVTERAQDQRTVAIIAAIIQVGERIARKPFERSTPEELLKQASYLLKIASEGEYD